MRFAVQVLGSGLALMLLPALAHAAGEAPAVWGIPVDFILFACTLLGVAVLAGPEDGNAADCLTEGEAGKFPTGISVSEILENPQDYYINVHNPDYPAGAIRGQLFYQADE